MMLLCFCSPLRKSSWSLTSPRGFLLRHIGELVTVRGIKMGSYFICKSFFQVCHTEDIWEDVRSMNEVKRSQKMSGTERLESVWGRTHWRKGPERKLWNSRKEKRKCDVTQHLRRKMTRQKLRETLNAEPSGRGTQLEQCYSTFWTESWPTGSKDASLF